MKRRQGIFGEASKIMQDMKGYLEVEQANSIIQGCTNPRDKLLIMLLFNTGRRESEALSLLVNDIDYKGHSIYWQILKRKDLANTKIPIPAKKTLLVSLKRYIEANHLKSDEHIFRSSHRPGKAINRHRVYQIVRKWGERAGIMNVGKAKMHPHVCRHSFAIWAARRIKNARDLVLLQKLMGHAMIENTAYYLQFAQSEAMELVNEMPDFINLGMDDVEINKLLVSDESLKFSNEKVVDKL